MKLRRILIVGLLCALALAILAAIGPKIITFHAASSPPENIPRIYYP